MKRYTGLLFASLLGCASSPPSQFFTLSADATARAAPSAQSSAGSTQSALSILVGPAEVPQSVDRPQLVLRASENRVRIVEEARWAEPLKNAIPAVLAEDLAQQLGTRRVFAYPQGGAGFDFQVLLDVLRFDSVPGESATVEIAWIVRPAEGAARSGRSRIRERVDGPGYEALVAAHSRALSAVSGEIARALGSPDPLEAAVR